MSLKNDRQKSQVSYSNLPLVVDVVEVVVVEVVAVVVLVVVVV